MNRVALVTGGTRGLGAAIALALQSEGYRVAVVYRSNATAAHVFHEATAIPLKTLLLNEQGQLLERFQFVQFQPDSDNNLQVSKKPLMMPSADCQTVSAVAAMPDAELDVDWSVSWVPPGFSLINSHYRPSEDSESNVLTQVYSDGLAHFSIFFERIDSPDAEGGRRLLGPTSVVSRKVTVDQQQVMVTVVGEIPLGTAERIAVSMQTGQEPSDD